MFRIFVCVKFKTIIMKRLFCITILLFMAFNIYAVTNSGETYIHIQVGIYDPDYLMDISLRVQFSFHKFSKTEIV